MRKTEWFADDRFGMFIHWGLYAIPSRGEWVRSVERISVEDYEAFFDSFNPVKYDPVKWARLAKKAGMKYAVMTAKHHDGFCLFDSKLTDYKSTNTQAKRDLVKEYVDAFRAEGIKVGLYYSLLDWHHPDYPSYGDLHHPMRENEDFKDKKYDFSKYVEYFHGQVRELLTNYGKIDLMWFDFSYDSKQIDMSMRGETWEATKLVEMMRSLMPDIIIDNRLGGDIKKAEPQIYSGDFASPEQVIPPTGILNEKGEKIPWEACITINDHWGYCSEDKNFKSARDIIRTLIECVSKNGNLLLNVGPNALGEIGESETKILTEVGKWLENNGESIYGAGISEFPKPEWGRLTQKGKKLYAHIFDRGVGLIPLLNIEGKIEQSARRLWDGSEIKLIRPWNVEAFPDDAFITLSSSELPDKNSAVIEITLKA